MKRALLLLLMAPVANAIELEPYVEYAHVSDLFRGPPINSKSEPTLDMLMVGVELYFKKAPQLRVDAAHGFKAISCTGGEDRCKWESGTRISVRYYFRDRQTR